MLRVIEFGLLGVSLVVIIGLIISGARKHSGDSDAKPDQRDKTQ